MLAKKNVNQYGDVNKWFKLKKKLDSILICVSMGERDNFLHTLLNTPYKHFISM